MDIVDLIAIQQLSDSLKQRARRGEIVFIREERRPGWTGPLPVYLFACPNTECPNHERLAMDYAHGFENHNRRLTCPDCDENKYFPVSWRHLFEASRTAIFSSFKQRRLLNGQK